MKGPRGLCGVEGCDNLQAPNHASYSPWCDRHRRATRSAPSERSKAGRLKKDYCEECGPDVEYHPCQLDLDHIDGDRTNDDPENHKTLCANHHRLKSWLERQGVNTKLQYPKQRRMERHGGPK